MDAMELVKRNLIVKHLAGSHAYGTNTATSDIDYRGIFCADPVNIRTPFCPIKETVDSSEEDTKYYELAQFMKLTLECNPNVVETLWVDESDIIYKTEAYDILRRHREQFLSKKIIYSTTGYAMAQCKRLVGHTRWLTQENQAKDKLVKLYTSNQCSKQWLEKRFSPQVVEYVCDRSRVHTCVAYILGNEDTNFKDHSLGLISTMRPRQIDFISLVFNFTDDKLFKLDLEQFNKNHLMIHYGGNVYGIYQMDGYQMYNDDNYSLIDKYNDELHEHAKTLAPKYLVKFNEQEYKAQLEHYNNYWTWRNNRNEARAELEQKHGFDCYSDDTEFLTSEGWKLFDDINESTLLATFDNNAKIEYQPFEEKFDSLYTGNIYNLIGYHCDVLTTANHNMWVKPFSRATGTSEKWGFSRAGELPETFDTLNRISPKQNRQVLPKEINPKIFEYCTLHHYLRLMGWYISDGTCTFYPNGSVNSVMISQSKPQSRLTQNLNKIRNKGHLTSNHYVYPPRGMANFSENRWIFPNNISKILFEDCGHGSKHKRIPNWAFELTKRELTMLLVCLLQGDGSKRNHQTHTYVYHTTNKLLADDVQRLGFLAGFETSLYGPYNNSTTFSEELTVYQVHINMRPAPTRRHIRSKSVRSQLVKNQRVVCFMVKKYNTLVTRRNGHIGLHGNCKHAMHLVRLMNMGYEAVTQGVLIVKRPDAQLLLDIRNGAWSYDQLMAYAEEMDKKIYELGKKSKLRDTPDIKLASKVLMEVQDIMWSKQ